MGILYAGCDDDGPVNVPAEPPAPEPPTYSEDFGKQIVFTVKGVKFTMMLVEGGTYAMGATSEKKHFMVKYQNDRGEEKEGWVEYAEDDELPVHNVTLSNYYIGETEVTQELWNTVMGENPSNFKGDLQRPVEMVSWNDCQEFIAKLNKLTGKAFRLPTEAQWEFAAGGGNKTKKYPYSGGYDLDAVAWHIFNASETTHPVKTKRPNELHLYDMSGNVWEWCADWYGTYSADEQTDPTGPIKGEKRVVRGGAWSYGGGMEALDIYDEKGNKITIANIEKCKIKYFPVAYRNYCEPEFSWYACGLRLAL